MEAKSGRIAWKGHVLMSCWESAPHCNPGLGGPPSLPLDKPVLAGQLAGAPSLPLDKPVLAGPLAGDEGVRQRADPAEQGIERPYGPAELTCSLLVAS